MGKTILTAKQLDFLELVSQESQITKRFYFTGGTVLAEFYLKHRLSEDIDLFCEKEEINPEIVETFLQKISHKIGVIHIKRSQFLGLFSYKLIYKDGQELKVDFNYYPFPRIEKGPKFKNLEVASLHDIAADKTHTIFMRARPRDYIDLYFIFKNKKYSLKSLILDAKAKFDWDIDRITLNSQFLRVKDLVPKELPKMLVPFDQKDMEQFFLKLARSLEKEIFK